MHSNLMLRFLVQAFQNPPLCSSTVNSSGDDGNGSVPSTTAPMPSKISKLILIALQGQRLLAIR
jgi:hypothetical protein